MGDAQGLRDQAEGQFDLPAPLIETGEAARPFTAARLIHELSGRRTVNQLEQMVKHAILTLHGVGYFVSR